MKRKIFALSLCVIILFSFLMSFTAMAYEVSPIEGKMATVITESSNLRVRSGPGTSYALVSQISNGTLVNVECVTAPGDGYNWYKISVGNIEGFVRGDYIDIFDTPSSGIDPDFESYLNSQGFPESYRDGLRRLHTLHPKWKFTAVSTGVSWSEALTNESKVGINCVESSAIASWKSFEKGAYDWDNGTWYSLDSGGWTAASKEIIAYYLDPRNFFDDNIFMFLDCSYDKDFAVSASSIKSALSGTFMATDEWADGIVEAAEESKSSAIMLAARLRLEQGSKGNGLAHGTVSGYSGYYNPFDIGAWAHDGRSAVTNGAIYAKNKGWSSLLSSLIGGAKWLAASYINVGQNTLYLQKYDVVAGTNGRYSHQYMSNVSAPVSESSPLRNAVKNAGLYESSLNFIIPVFNSMPSALNPKPTSSGNNNNWLDSLTVRENSFTTPYALYTTDYELFTDTGDIYISAVAKDKNATVSGAGAITVPKGVSTVTITVTAPSGVKRNYNITVSNSGDSSGGNKFTSNYTKKDSFLADVSPQTTLAEFKSNLSISGYSPKYLDASGNSKSASDIMKTGDVLYLSSGLQYTIVIYGDSNGDGKLSSADLLRTQKSILSISSLSGAYREAADFNKDGSVNSRDLLTCQKRILGL